MRGWFAAWLVCAPLACANEAHLGAIAAGGSGGEVAGAAGAGGAGCVLMESGPVVIAADGQVVENLRIVATGSPAITVDGFSGVTIRNVVIVHAEGPGIQATRADDLTIEHVLVDHVGALASGPNPSTETNNVSVYDSARVRIDHARLLRGSSGIYLLQSPDSVLTNLEGHDFRGPLPRGQLVEWDKSDRGLLEGFSVLSSETSWPEANVDAYASADVIIRDGLIDGNNSPTGVGVIFNGTTGSGLVEDVDAVHMSNGCFSGFDGGPGIVFRRTRCRDTICTDQGRGLPTSGSVMWTGNPDHADLRIESSTYFNACNADAIVWPAASFAVSDLTETDFVPRAALVLGFCWE